MKVILHCSDSSFGNAALIAKWHTVERGWSNIGYHLVILNGQISSKAYNKYFNGLLETGRPFNDDNEITSDEVGAHTYGFNRDSISICLIGKSGKFTIDQESCLLNVALPLLQEIFGSLLIGQHSDYDSKKPHCAGLDPQFIKELNDLFS